MLYRVYMKRGTWRKWIHTRSGKITLVGVCVLLVAAVTFLIIGKSEKELVPELPLVQNEVVVPEVPTGKTFKYMEVVGGCDWTGVGACVNIRSGPGTTYPVIAQLRAGVVLEVGESVEVEGLTWYKVIFTTWLRYPERVEGDLYVALTDSVNVFTDVGPQEASKSQTSLGKRIVVDISEQVLYAYEGDVVFMKEKVSTGLSETPTPRGKFFVFRKTPTRYMQGPIPEVSEQYYDLPGVPWDLYFTSGGAVIHGAYWHNSYGMKWSHGCVNLPVDQAKKLYYWADVGIPVVVQD